MVKLIPTQILVAFVTKDQVSSSAPPSAPAAPSSVALADDALTSSTSIHVTWADPAGSLTTLRCQLDLSGGDFSVPIDEIEISPSVESVEFVTGLAPNNGYDCRIRAENSEGNSEWVSINVGTRPSPPSLTPTNGLTGIGSASVAIFLSDGNLGISDFTIYTLPQEGYPWTFPGDAWDAVTGSFPSWNSQWSNGLLQNGDFTMEVRAINSLNLASDAASVAISMINPE